MTPLDGLFSFVLLVAGLLIVYGPWQTLCTDYARQYLFEARDALFDMALNGELQFESPEYRTIRSSLEKSIRFAHAVTWLRFAVFLAAMETRGLTKKKSDLRQAIDQIENPETRAKVSALVAEAFQKSVLATAFKSPLIMFGAVVALLITAIRFAPRAAAQSMFAQVGDIIQVEAEGSA